MLQKKLEKILFVEDDPNIRAIGLIALVDVGNFNVLACQDGHEALQKAEAFAPDLFLFDRMMPNMDGLTLFHELQKISTLQSVPCIFMTAKVQEIDMNIYRENGALTVIAKPFDAMTLADTIREKWSLIPTVS